MQTRLLSFIDALRDLGLPITVAETLDAMRAVGVIGIERSAFREGVAATLVKDEADRPAFNAAFDRFFAVPGRQRGQGEPPRTSEEGEGRGAGKPGTLARSDHDTEPRRGGSTHRQASERHHEGAQHDDQHEERGQQLARERALQHVAFHAMPARQAQECDVLVAELAQSFRAHLKRRQRSAHRGRLDVRRTLRRSISSGGVPIDPAFRHAQPGRPDLVALCDHSHSVATASHFLLALLAPAQAFFRRVRLFAFVDWPVEVSVARGVLVPHERLDLYARSDFGRVLVAFWEHHEPLLTRNTILLILGDARNNRRAPRADILGRIHSVVRELVWLNPEPPPRWNTDDSVMRTYQRHCDTVLAASTLRELYIALRHAFRTV